MVLPEGEARAADAALTAGQAAARGAVKSPARSLKAISAAASSRRPSAASMASPSAIGRGPPVTQT